jgi:hypothetical protein
VSGEGPSFTTALNNAFKKAIDYEVGIIIDSERHAINRKLTHNQILTYNAGYIVTYQILEHTPLGEFQHVMVDVTVNSSKLKDFVLSRYTSTEKFDGENISKQIEYYKKQQVDGDKLIDNTFKYFSTDAINIQMHRYEIIKDANRKFYVKVYYTASWNKTYLESLKELMSLFAVDESNGFVIMLNFDGEILFFDDNIIKDKIGRTFHFSSMVNLTANSLLGDTVLNTCVQDISSAHSNKKVKLYTSNGTGINFYTNRSVDNFILKEIDQQLAMQIQDVSQLKLSIKSPKDCR